MSLLDDLARIGETSQTPRTPKPDYPSGWQPGTTFAGREGTICGAAPAGNSTNFDELLTDWGYDPLLVEVLEPIERRSWDAAIGGGEVRRLHYIKAKLRSRANGSRADVTALAAQISKHRPAKRPAPTGDTALIVALSDWQLGKPDGDGTAGTVARVLAAIDAVTQRTKDLRRAGVTLGSLYVLGLGDVVEGCDGHYASQAFGVELTQTEQERVARRLIVKALTTWAPLFERVIVAAVPGNHGEIRNGSGKAYTTPGDNLDLAVFEQAAAVLEANEAAYGHVRFVYPARDELTVTLDIAGTTTCLAHGHQFKTGGPMRWWAEQAHGQQHPGDATLLLAGHKHQLLIEDAGAKCFIQAPALEGESSWWRATHGSPGKPGLLTLTVNPDGWDNLKIL